MLSMVLGRCPAYISDLGSGVLTQGASVLLGAQHPSMSEEGAPKNPQKRPLRISGSSKSAVKLGGLKDPFIVDSFILGLIAFTPPTFIPPFEPP